METVEKQVEKLRDERDDWKLIAQANESSIKGLRNEMERLHAEIFRWKTLAELEKKIVDERDAEIEKLRAEMLPHSHPNGEQA
jgi:hypothetical protein